MKDHRVALGLLDKAEEPRFAPQIPRQHAEPCSTAETTETPSQDGQRDRDSTGDSNAESEGSADTAILDDLELAVEAGLVSPDGLAAAVVPKSGDTSPQAPLAASVSSADDVEPRESVERPPIEFTQPTPPSLASADCRALSIEWESITEAHPADPSDDRPRPEIHFQLEMQMVECNPKKKLDTIQQLQDSKWETVATGKQRSHKVTGLKPGLKYAFRIACQLVPVSGSPAVEVHKPSNVAIFQTKPAPPSAPTPVILTSKERKALKFKWPVPEETGGFHDLTYVLELYPPPQPTEAMEQYNENFVVVYRGPETTFKVTKLHPGVQYYVRVLAQNDLGSGPFSAVGEFKTAATVPAQPSPPVCYAVMPSSVYLHWAPPPCNGAPITRYQVQMAHAAEPETWSLVFTGLDNKCEIHNVQPGQGYVFRMSCENDIGKSSYSSSLEIVTTAAPPGPPGSAGISNIHLTSADVQWHPPAWEGGAPVVHYEVQLYPKSPAALVGGLPQNWVPVFQDNDTKCSVFGLRGGCTYGIRVCCFNQAGVSEFSSVVEFTTAPDLPEPPIPPAITRAGPGTLDVAWGPPMFDGGDPVTSYQLEMCIADDGDWTLGYSGPEPGCHLHGLVPGATYSLRVSCANRQGNSPFSDVVLGATMPAPPCAPEPPSVVTVSSTAICLAWAPPSENGAPVTSYILQEVRVGDQQDVQFVQLYQGPHTVFEAKGLQPYTEYGFRVRAANSAGAGEWGTVAICRTSSAAPGKPQGIELLPQGPEDLQVRWDPPAECFGLPVTGYLVEISTVSKSKKAASWAPIYNGPEQQCQADGLRAGREYSVRIRAANKVGNGSFCAAVSCRTMSSAPDAPGALTFSQRASRSIKARWQAPEEDHGAAVSSFSLEIADLPAPAAESPPGPQASWPLSAEAAESLQWRKAYTGPSCTAKVSGLEAGRAYAFRAFAHNSVGPSPPGAVECVVTSLAPPLQMDPPATSGGLDQSSGQPNLHLAQVEVRWQAPQRGENCAAPAGFEVEVIEVRQETGASPSGVDKSFRSLVTASKDATSCVVAGLLGEKTYSARVRAVGEAGAGHGAWSDISSCVTPAVAPAPSPSGREILEDATAPAVAVKKGGGRKAKQRKGKQALAESDLAGKTGPGVKTTAAKRPPKRERLFSRRNINWMINTALVVITLAGLVFISLLWYKTEMGPQAALQQHYMDRELAAARHRQTVQEGMPGHQEDWVQNLSPEYKEKLTKLQAIWAEAQEYAENGMEVPATLVDRLDALDIPPELMQLIDPDLAAQMESYAEYYEGGYPEDQLRGDYGEYDVEQYEYEYEAPATRQAPPINPTVIARLEFGVGEAAGNGFC